jgi:general secretion pathway protein H
VRRVSGKSAQAGFTLIELMVVVVIMAVVVSVGLIAMAPSEQAVARAHERSVKALLGYARDQAALTQRLYLLAVDEHGLTLHRQTSQGWQLDAQVKTLKWPDALTVTWEVDNSGFVAQQNLPAEGWVFWPSGDVLGGAIVMHATGTDVSRGESPSAIVRWNGVLQFTNEVEDAP